MKALIYEFDKILNCKKGNYIFQFVQERQLSDIYHSHDFYEIYFVIYGSCTTVINEKNYSFEENDFCILRPNDRHRFCAQSDDLQLLCLSVEKNEFEKIINIYSANLKDKLTKPFDPTIIRKYTSM